MLVKRRDASAPEVPVTPERARELYEELRQYTSSGDRSSLTPGEDNYVRRIWETKPGTWSWLRTLSYLRSLPETSEK